MSRRMRSASAGSRIAVCGGRERAFEADETADERVVTAVRGVSVPLAEKAVEPVLGRRERAGNRDAAHLEPRRADRDEERLDRLDARLQIGESPLDELGARNPIQRPLDAHVTGGP
jgi:hypothetical protein